MNTKRKLMLGVASLGVLVVLAGVALGITLAALTGTVNSGFTISYSAKNVKAAIVGAYDVANIPTPSSTLLFYSEQLGLTPPPFEFENQLFSRVIPGRDEIDLGILSIPGVLFTGLETSADKSDSFEGSLDEELELTSDWNFLTFMYTIQNLDTENPLSINFSLTGQTGNLDVSYCALTETEYISRTSQFEAKLDELGYYETYYKPAIEYVGYGISDKDAYLMCIYLTQCLITYPEVFNHPRYFMPGLREMPIETAKEIIELYNEMVFDSWENTLSSQGGEIYNDSIAVSDTLYVFTRFDISNNSQDVSYNGNFNISLG